ncbi:MAG: DUF6691 family protein, partial [Gammaproteobacteria bacterium]
MNHIISFICGLLFGCGLTISNMINPSKIQNFLDVTGNWDPSLAFVMFSALVVTWIGYKFVLRKKRPEFTENFFLPTKKSVDKPLILGSALFGIGWGLAGYCPGPAITALGLGIMDAVYFVVGMIASACIFPIFSFLYRKGNGKN